MPQADAEGFRGIVTGAVAAFGLAAAGHYVGLLLAASGGPRVVTGAVAGMITWRTVLALTRSRGFSTAMMLLVVPVAAVVIASVLVVPLDLGVPAAELCGALLAAAPYRLVVSGTGLLGVAMLLASGSVAGAGAWSVDEPAPDDPRMVAGDGIVVSMDTHAFLVQQGAAILRNERPRVGRFLDSVEPATGNTYLWPVQLGARDADRVLKKPVMPDHFFNWWTHSGKGLMAGDSAATYAEEQYAQAVQRWRAGDRSAAMYHLGAATHLVDDACAPPHAAFLIPNHRRYEELMLAAQDAMATDSGGIYRDDFRRHGGHGGPGWSSAHTRGWVDECAHRASELVLAAAMPPPDDPVNRQALPSTAHHFRQSQRLTAGYLAFFFDSVGGP